MNNLTRSIVVAISLTLCAAGLICAARESAGGRVASPESMGDIGPQSGYQFASTDHKYSFAQLEAIVRADAAIRFPRARMELGSVKTEHGIVTMTVVFFADQQAHAFLYGLVPEKNSWKITSTRRLWFVPPSQIARGLRV